MEGACVGLNMAATPRVAGGAQHRRCNPKIGGGLFWQPVFGAADSAGMTLAAGSVQDVFAGSSTTGFEAGPGIMQDVGADGISRDTTVKDGKLVA